MISYLTLFVELVLFVDFLLCAPCELHCLFVVLCILASFVASLLGVLSLLCCVPLVSFIVSLLWALLSLCCEFHYFLDMRSWWVLSPVNFLYYVFTKLFNTSFSSIFLTPFQWSLSPPCCALLMFFFNFALFCSILVFHPSFFFLV